jgi:hypothetical protein
MIPEELELPAAENSHQLEVLGFSGWRKDWVSVARLEALFEPAPLEAVQTSDRFICLKHKSDKGSWVYRTRWDMGEGPQDYFIKVFSEREVFRVMGQRMFSMKGLRRPWRYPRKLILRMLSPSEARISWVAASALKAKAIHTPEPVAYFSRRKGVLRDEFFITRAVEFLQGANLRKYFNQRLADADRMDWVKEKRGIIQDLAEFFRQVMESGVFFPDLKLHNLLLAKPADEPLCFYISDTNEALFRPVDELIMLDHFNRNPDNRNIITNLDRVRFLKAYLACRNDDRDWREVCKAVETRALSRQARKDRKD